MVSLVSLWLPIVLSAVGVFIASSIIHMVFKYHASDHNQIPNEDAVRAAIRAGNPSPKQYFIPWAADMAAFKGEEMKRKLAEGPVAVVHVGPNGEKGMGAAFGGWIVFSLVISFTVAYVASTTLEAGTASLKVLQVTGTVGWLAYAAGQVPSSIWMKKPWSVTWKEVLDGLIYGLVTGGFFAWLWPG
jgi:hypothetical protein